MRKSVDEAFASAGIGKKMIPLRFTNLLQPADVCWFASVKKKLHEKWTDWYINDESDIWQSSDSQIISKSFDRCGITSNQNLSRALKAIVENDQCFSEYVVDETECSDLEMSDEHLFELETLDILVPLQASTITPSVLKCSKCPRI